MGPVLEWTPSWASLPAFIEAHPDIFKFPSERDHRYVLYFDEGTLIDMD